MNNCSYVNAKGAIILSEEKKDNINNTENTENIGSDGCSVRRPVPDTEVLYDLAELFKVFRAYGRRDVRLSSFRKA